MFGLKGMLSGHATNIGTLSLCQFGSSMIRMPSSVLSPVALWTCRGVQLIVGLVAYGIAIGLMLCAGIGLPSWDVLGQGIATQTGLLFGLVVNIVGVLVLLLWISIRQKPGVGTVLNVLLIGPSAELGLWLVLQQTVLWQQGLVFAGGLAFLVLATGLYVGVRLGSGPRDGLMTGIHVCTGWLIWVVRTGIEVTVFVAGFLFGGQVGIGMFVFVLLIGLMVNVMFFLLCVLELWIQLCGEEVVV